MIEIFYIVLPIYFAIGLGFGLVRTKLFSPDDMRVLGRFVMTIAFPALIFHSVVTRPLAEVLNPDYMITYGLAGLVMIGLSFSVFSLLGWDARTRAAGVMGASCPNNGFVGYAFFLLAMPDQATLIVVLNFLVENILIVPICLMLLRSAEDDQGAGLSRIAGILWSVLKTPLIIALLLGIVVNLAGLGLPKPVEHFTGILAGAASALGLIVIGGALASLPPATRFARAGFVALGKVAVAPAVAALVAFGLTGLGVVALSPQMFAIVVLLAAMPTFTIFVVFAQELRLEGFASVVLAIATLSAFVSLSVLLALLT